MPNLQISNQASFQTLGAASSNLRAISADRAAFNLKGQAFTIGKSIYQLSQNQQHHLIELLSPKTIKNFVFENKGDHKVATFAGTSAVSGQMYFVTLKTGLKNDVHALTATSASFSDLLNDGLDDDLPVFSAFFVKDHGHAMTPSQNQAPSGTVNPEDLHSFVNEGDMMFIDGQAFMSESLNATGQVNRLLDPQSQNRLTASLALMQGENPEEALAAYALGRTHAQDQAELKALKEGLRQQEGSDTAHQLIGQDNAKINGLRLMSQLEGAQLSSPIDKQQFIAAFLNKDTIVIDDALSLQTGLSSSVAQGFNHVLASVHLSDDAPVKKNIHSSLLQEAQQPSQTKPDVVLVLNAKKTNCKIDGYGMKDDGVNVQLSLNGRHKIEPEQVIRTQDGYMLIGHISFFADKKQLNDAENIQQALLHGYA